jgi:acyl-CoA thioesterase
MSATTATSVLPELAPGAGGLTATFAADARSWAGVHGGLVVGALLDAAAETTGRVPVAVTAHLHAAVDPGPVRLTTTAVSTGRAVTSATAVLEQERRRATASVLLVAPEDPARHWPAGCRDLASLPGPEDVDRLTGMEGLVPVARYFDIRPVREARPLAGGDVPELTAWVRLLPGAAFRAAVAPVLLDALAPALYAVATTPLAIPTVEFTVHLTPTEPVDEWLLVDQRTTWSSGAFCVDEADLVDRSGRLVAQSRQLRRILG